MNCVNKFFSAIIIIAFISLFGCQNCRDNEQRKYESEDTNPKKERKRLRNASINVYDKDFILKHDIAVTKWFTFQCFAMEYIALDENGKPRLKSYLSISKFHNKPDDVLTSQEAAVKEFSETYAGNDKDELLQQWYWAQLDALNVLKTFLKEINYKNKTPTSSVSNKYEKIIKDQRLLYKGIERYSLSYRVSVSAPESFPGCTTGQK